MLTYNPLENATKVVFRRIIAYFIDMAIVYGIGFGIFLATADLTSYEGFGSCALFDSTDVGCFEMTSNGKTTVYLFESKAIIYTVVAVFIYWVVFTWIIQGLQGWSPGKLITGIRVVNAQGTGPGLGRTFGRELLMIVDNLCSGLVGLITMLTTKNHQRVGDLVCGTYVVGADYRRKAIAGGASAGAPAGAAAGAAAAPAFPPVPGGTGPQWDAARGAWIQYDQTNQAWLRFDEFSNQWTPLA